MRRHLNNLHKNVQNNTQISLQLTEFGSAVSFGHTREQSLYRHESLFAANSRQILQQTI